mmetsp:Transcript_10800/g.33572  ORF Transcript_10800/g.33572 Transcript_10800/m.33572 type:complete len:510 (+) Transcript_10800:2509-4038(+)
MPVSETATQRARRRRSVASPSAAGPVASSTASATPHTREAASPMWNDNAPPVHASACACHSSAGTCHAGAMDLAVRPPYCASRALSAAGAPPVSGASALESESDALMQLSSVSAISCSSCCGAPRATADASTPPSAAAAAASSPPAPSSATLSAPPAPRAGNLIPDATASGSADIRRSQRRPLASTATAAAAAGTIAVHALASKKAPPAPPPARAAVRTVPSSPLTAQADNTFLPAAPWSRQLSSTSSPSVSGDTADGALPSCAAYEHSAPATRSASSGGGSELSGTPNPLRTTKRGMGAGQKASRRSLASLESGRHSTTSCRCSPGLASAAAASVSIAVRNASTLRRSSSPAHMELRSRRLRLVLTPSAAASTSAMSNAERMLAMGTAGCAGSQPAVLSSSRKRESRLTGASSASGVSASVSPMLLSTIARMGTPSSTISGGGRPRRRPPGAEPAPPAPEPEALSPPPLCCWPCGTIAPAAALAAAPALAACVPLASACATSRTTLSA